MGLTSKVMMVAILVILGLGGLWAGLSHLSVRGIESPEYVVVSSEEGYEVREYGEYIVAETEVAGGYSDSVRRGFRILADYIFGNNTKQAQMEMTAPVMQEAKEVSERIAMTAPVIQERKERVYVISFVMPSGYTLETLPRPNNPVVKIRKTSKKKVAVLRFSGYATEGRVHEKQALLGELLERDGYRTRSGFRIAQYNPPWTPPFMRRNEVMADIQ